MALNYIFDLFSFTTTPGMRYLYILLMSLLSAVLFLFIFKKTSNQEKIARYKNQMFGHILQMRLYKDFFRVLLLSIGGIFKYNILYLGQTLVSLLVMLIPLLIITLQINNRCGYEPLGEQQQFLVRAEVDASDSNILEQLVCEMPPELRLETPPLRIMEENQVFWRARVLSSNTDNSPLLRIGDKNTTAFAEKPVVTHYGLKRFVPEKRRRSFWNALFYSGEGYLPNTTPIQSISITYQRAGYSLVFWKIDAIILYFFFTLVFAFGLKDLLGVNI